MRVNFAMQPEEKRVGLACVDDGINVVAKVRMINAKF
jgi:hypothetical protein